MRNETVWQFETAQLRVTLELSPSFEPYDGDDDGETQQKLDDGVWVQFDSIVRVVHIDTNAELGFDSLGASVYETPSEFWTAHRDSNPMNRNCEAYRAKHGQNAVICHYFPGMVAEACKMARAKLANLSSFKVRENAQ